MGLQPRVFHYSLDWRFLLPVADAKNIYLLREENEDFSQTLSQVGIDISQQVAFSDLRQKKNNEIQSFVIPFGLPSGSVSPKGEDQVEFYSSVRRLIISGGYLLVGFHNVWNARVNSPYRVCTPRRMTAQLKQAGFPSIQIFGAMPNLAIPAYIFDLESEPAHFALQNRFRRKPTVLRVLGVLSRTLGWKRLSNFLPCYFAVATA
jgi:hypothetical protein